MIEYLEAENTVVGSLLIDPRALPEIAASLTPEDFGSAVNRTIYQAALALDRAGGVIDPVTILHETRRMGEEIPGSYLAQLMDTTPTAANVAEYIKLVREEALRRGIRAALEQARAKLDGHAPACEVLSEAADQLDKLQQHTSTGELYSPDDAIMAFYTHRDAVDSGRTGTGFVPTGYRDLDNTLGGGMLASGMYVLAARPGIGKTTLALNIADRTAKKVGPVLFVSLEMDVEQITAKRISMETGIPAYRLLMRRLEETENTKMAQAVDKLHKLPLYINRKPDATMAQIETMARNVKGLRLLIIDYLGKISPGDRGRMSRYEYTTEISGLLKSLARKLKIPVLVLAQLNRQTEGRADHRPQLSDLRDTGATEQDADGVIFLTRTNYYERDADAFATEDLEVVVAKNRHGPVGDCKLQFAMHTGRILAESNDPRRAWRNDPEYRQQRAADQEA